MVLKPTEANIKDKKGLLQVKAIRILKVMIPGIGTIVNGVGVLVVGILSRVIFKKELERF